MNLTDIRELYRSREKYLGTEVGVGSSGFPDGVGVGVGSSGWFPLLSGVGTGGCDPPPFGSWVAGAGGCGVT